MDAQIIGTTKGIVPGRKRAREPARNIDMVKGYGGNDFVQRYVFK